MNHLIFTITTLIIVFISSYTQLTTSSSITRSIYKNGEFQIIENEQEFLSYIGQPNVIIGEFNDSLNKTGWGNLEISAFGGADDSAQMYAAGYTEGALTAARIYQNSVSLNAITFKNGKIPQQVSDFFTQQQSWVMNKTSTDNSPRWQAIGLIMDQLSGLMDGYASSSTGQQFPLTMLDFQLLQANGDIDDIIAAVVPGGMPDWEHWSEKKIITEFNRRARCSSMVKVNGDLSSLWIGHSTWYSYSAMNRIYKSYNFNLSSTFVATRAMSFSSYPGFLMSVDDFWMMDSGIAMTETTNSIFNTSLYSLVTPQSLLSWQRIRAANLMATSGPEWADIIAQDNSGTYNNQYIILDFKLFDPTKGLQENTLWIAEQIPGLVVSADMTRDLERGHWPSYNVPYFYEIYEQSGYTWMKNRLSAEAAANFDYQQAPRAKIFRRSNGNVTSIETIGDFLRYNDYLNDPYSSGNPMNTICSRGDLLSTSPMDMGCIDTKVTSDVLFQNGQAWTINGPTTSNGLPVFQWSDHSEWVNIGLPDVYNFPFVLQTNEAFSSQQETSKVASV